MQLEKYCSRCRKVKPINDFRINPRTKDGLFCFCRICQNEANKILYQRNKEKRIQQISDWNLKNKEKTSKYKRNWYHKNK